jgi:hypothetical protein
MMYILTTGMFHARTGLPGYYTLDKRLAVRYETKEEAELFRPEWPQGHHLKAVKE